MTSRISRRAFLKGSITAAGSVAATTGLARTARAITKKEQEPLVTLIDISKCIGCEECVFACQESNREKYPEPEKPFPKMFPKRVPVQDWSEKMDVIDRLTPYNWLFIQHAFVTIDGEETELTIPRRCMHCENPPCVKLCPWGAAKQEDNGLSRIDSDLCLGGAKCKSVCPWHIPERQTGSGIYLDILPSLAGNGNMHKCDRCYDKLAHGEQPACIDICPEDVQTIGPRSEILKQAHALAKETKGYIYGEHENGGTNTIYVSPVPFDQLNKSIEKGKGKPHFKKVDDMMAQGTNIAKAMLIAPVAGIAAAFGKFYLSSKEGKQMKTTGKLRKYIYGITFFFLVLTGFGQMPVYKRYYISDIPGLDWLSQFYVTHMIHYIASSVLIALVIYIFISFILQGSGRITESGYLKIIILAGLIVSGALMVIRNLSDVFLGHNFIIALNLIHLGLCMMLMAVSFYTLITKRAGLNRRYKQVVAGQKIGIVICIKE